MLGQALVPSPGPAQRLTGWHGHETPCRVGYTNQYNGQLKSSEKVNYQGSFGFVYSDIRPTALTPTFVR